MAWTLFTSNCLTWGERSYAVKFLVASILRNCHGWRTSVAQVSRTEVVYISMRETDAVFTILINYLIKMFIINIINILVWFNQQSSSWWYHLLSSTVCRNFFRNCLLIVLSENTGNIHFIRKKYWDAKAPQQNA